MDLAVTNDGSLYYLARGSGSVFRVQFSNPTASNGVISGQLATSSAGAVEGATIRLTGNQTRKTITDANGNYRFDNVSTNNSYTVTPSRVNYTFNPFNRLVCPAGQQHGRRIYWDIHR